MDGCRDRPSGLGRASRRKDRFHGAGLRPGHWRCGTRGCRRRRYVHLFHSRDASTRVDRTPRTAMPLAHAVLRDLVHWEEASPFCVPTRPILWKTSGPGPVAPANTRGGTSCSIPCDPPPRTVRWNASAWRSVTIVINGPAMPKTPFWSRTAAGTAIDATPHCPDASTAGTSASCPTRPPGTGTASSPPDRTVARCPRPRSSVPPAPDLLHLGAASPGLRARERSAR